MTLFSGSGMVRGGYAVFRTHPCVREWAGGRGRGGGSVGCRQGEKVYGMTKLNGRGNELRKIFPPVA